MAGTVTIGGAQSGTTSGSKIIGPMTISGSASFGSITDVLLNSGDNSIAVPPGATAAVIVPPSNYTGTLKYRTSSLDSGVFISPSNPTVISFDPANLPTAFLLNASSSSSSSFCEISFI